MRGKLPDLFTRCIRAVHIMRPHGMTGVMIVHVDQNHAPACRHANQTGVTARRIKGLYRSRIKAQQAGPVRYGERQGKG